MAIKFQWLKEIIKETSNETGVSIAEITRMWEFTEDQIAKYIRDPSAPKVIVNRFFKFQADIKKVERRIFLLLHKIRNAKGEPKKQRIEVINLLKIRTRLIEEDKSWEKQTKLAKARNKKKTHDTKRKIRSID